MQHPSRFSRRRFMGASTVLAAGLVLPPAARVLAAEAPLRSDPFTLGVASGYPTATSVVLWTRLAPEPLIPGAGMGPESVPVQWEVASDEGFRSVVARGRAIATAEWSHSLHVEPRGLGAARTYWYRFTAGGIRSPVGRTRTAPAAGAATQKLRVDVACCAQYEHGYFSAYRHIAADAPDLVLHVGDYIYEYGPGPPRVRQHNSPEIRTLDEYRARYALYKSDRDLQAAHAAAPWMVLTDDHEVENDYAGEGAERDDAYAFLQRRTAAYRAYYENMPLPSRAQPTATQMRLYTQRAFGDLAAVTMLDNREYRSPSPCPPPDREGNTRRDGCTVRTAEQRTMLGAAQEAWLQTTLAATRSRWNLLAQGAVMSQIDQLPGEGQRFRTDGWDGFPAARARLAATLQKTRTANPMVLSGDIHAFMVGGLTQRADDPESPLVAPEFVATSISSNGINQGALDNWRKDNPRLLHANSEKRGYLRIDLTHERAHVDLVQVNDVTNENSGATVQRSYELAAGKPDINAV
ncbi:MAG: alkaline phosphatase D family protein [Pseudomonadota bacterium]